MEIVKSALLRCHGRPLLASATTRRRHWRFTWVCGWQHESMWTCLCRSVTELPLEAATTSNVSPRWVSEQTSSYLGCSSTANESSTWCESLHSFTEVLETQHHRRGCGLYQHRRRATHTHTHNALDYYTYILKPKQLNKSWHSLRETYDTRSPHYAQETSLIHVQLAFPVALNNDNVSATDGQALISSGLSAKLGLRLVVIQNSHGTSRPTPDMQSTVTFTLCNSTHETTHKTSI